MKLKFINLLLIMMLSIPPAQLLAAEDHINNSELDQYLDQDVFQLDENVEENYTLGDNSVENDIEGELKNEEFEIVETNNLDRNTGKF